MSLCSEAAMRHAMTDAEFWEHVFAPTWIHNPRLDQHAFDGIDAEEFELMSSINSTCTECGESGPCGYDADGRPYLHIASNQGGDEDT